MDLLGGKRKNLFGSQSKEIPIQFLYLETVDQEKGRRPGGLHIIGIADGIFSADSYFLSLSLGLKGNNQSGGIQSEFAPGFESARLWRAPA